MIRAANAKPGRRTLRVGHWVWLATDHGGRLPAPTLAKIDKLLASAG